MPLPPPIGSNTPPFRPKFASVDVEMPDLRAPWGVVGLDINRCITSIVFICLWLNYYTAIPFSMVIAKISSRYHYHTHISRTAYQLQPCYKENYFLLFECIPSKGGGGVRVQG